jgi:SAM-dependent methyltransferase
MGSSKVEGELWGGRARDWATYGEPTCTDLFDAMLDAADVGPGTKHLDMGCGAGGALVKAAARGAEVYGFDASANLLEIARERLPDVEYKQGDIEALPYPDETFDVVFAANSVQYAESQEQAVREALRVKKPDGKFVIGMWCEPERCEMSGLFKALSPDGPPPGAPPTLSSHENLIDLLVRAGGHVDAEGEVCCDFKFASIEDTLRCHRSAGIMQMFEQKLGADFVENAIRTTHEPFRQADGSYSLKNWFRWAVCT